MNCHIQKTRVWEEKVSLPVEVGELSPQFKKRMGWKENHDNGNLEKLNVHISPYATNKILLCL